MNIFLLAGDREKSVSKYLTDKGVDIYKSVESLTDELFYQTINVDKFVIVDSGFHIVSNMKVFKKLLDYEFFSCKEIIFIGDPKRNTVDFFKMALDEATTKYQYRVYVGEVISLNSIYLYIFNISKSKELKDNVYQNVYREPYERKVLVTEDENIDEDEIITKKNFMDIAKYEDLKRTLLYSKDTVVYDEEEAPKVDVEIKDFKDTEFESPPTLTERKNSNLVLISGERKSGKSVLVAGLLSSLIKLEKSVLIIDAQENESTTKIVKHYYDAINVLNLKDCKCNYDIFEKYMSDEENAISLINLNTKDIDIDIVLNVIKMLEDYFTLFDVILIDVPIYNKKYVYLFKQCYRLLLSTSTRRMDIDSLAKIVKDFDIKENICIVLSKVFTELDDIDYYSIEDIVEIFDQLLNDFSITTEYQFNGLDVEEKLALTLLGGAIRDDDNN